MDAYDTPIEDLGLSSLTYDCIKQNNIETVGQIMEMNGWQLLSIRNLERSSCYELRQQLIKHGFMSAFEPIGPFAYVWFNDA
jgi:DNA-directed RNA polymerase subunit alpha